MASGRQRVLYLLCGLACLGMIKLFSQHQDVFQRPEKYQKIDLDVRTSSFPASQHQQGNRSICYESPYVICGDYPLVDRSYREKFGPHKKLKLEDNERSLSPGLTSYTTDTPMLRRKEKYRVAQYNHVKYVAPYNASKCEYSNCEFAGFEIDESVDVVLTEGVRVHTPNPVPRRWPHQIYALLAWESAVHFNGGLLTRNTPWRHFFNLTITFRRDADIFTPNSYLVYVGDTENTTQLGKEFRRKKKTAVWFVSNCRTPSQRMNYVRQLQKYIDVDIYGNCGKRCSTHFPNLECKEADFDNYKFYLSFENSFYTDYITEKFWKVFLGRKLIVPVVRGGADVHNILPPGTFINAGDFPKAKNLGLYLKSLAANEAEYTRLLQNKLVYRKKDITSQSGAFHCELCEYLNKRDLNRVRFYNIQQWMGVCQKPNDI